MAITVVLVAAAGVVGVGLSLGAAILLGAVLAPTDPVLASDVQVSNPQDQDQLRFALTGEAGLNDGTAFPFVMLGLGLLSHHELGSFGWRWIAVDVVWAVASGIAVGAVLGTVVGYLVLHLRRQHRSAVGLDDFLTLGLIALSYGSALIVHGYGFLAVFAAGLALRRLEQRETGPELEKAVEALNAGGDLEEIATDAKTAPAYMAQALLGFNEQLERIGEVALVVVIGALLFTMDLPIEALWFIPLLLLVIRPAAVWVGLLGARAENTQRHLISWFGIRGIGSLYYLMFAVVHQLEEDTAAELTGLVLLCIAVSVVVHGTSVTPLMARYQRKIDAGSVDPNPGPP
jgi:NhaP-type Na+/H+ or K+/H+ antiporter